MTNQRKKESFDWLRPYTSEVRGHLCVFMFDRACLCREGQVTMCVGEDEGSVVGHNDPVPFTFPLHWSLWFLWYAAVSVLMSNHTNECWKAYSLPVSELLLSHVQDTNDQYSFQQAYTPILLHLFWPLFLFDVRSLMAKISSRPSVCFSVCFYQYSTLSFSNLSFLLSPSHTHCLSLYPSSLFCHISPLPAHLLGDPSLCLPAYRQGGEQKGLCFLIIIT